MSSLRAELDRMKPNLGGPVCHVCEALEHLSTEDALALREALESRQFHATMIGKAMTNNGHAVSVGSIRRHRRGECVGGKKT